MPAPTPPSDVPPLDAAAIAAITRRLCRSADGQPPWLARTVAQRMAERLAIVKLQPARVLDVSGWLGASGDVLRDAYPQAQRLVVEPDAEAARRLAPAASRPWWAPWRVAPAAAQVIPTAEPPPAGVQLLWSNLQLGRCVDPPAEIARWHDAVEPGGFVMFSALGPATLQELGAPYARAGWGPPAAPFTDMHDYGDMLVRAGFADPVMDQERLQLTWADADALLRDLRAIGGNAHPARFPGLRTPRWRATLRAALDGLPRADARLVMTVEVAYGHAFRVERRSVRGSETTIPVEALRNTARSFPHRGEPRHDLG